VANRLKMATVEAIAALVARGWSQRRIARELGVNRETVGRYVALARRPGEAVSGASAESGVCEASPSPGIDPSKPAKSPLGSADSKPAKAPLGSVDAPLGSDGSKPATEAPIGSATAAPESAGPSDVCVPSNGGFIALRPPADEGTLAGAATEDRATLGSDPSAAAAPNGTGGILTGAARLVESPRATCLFTVPPTSRSQCEPFRPIILAKLQQGLKAQRIYQDLVTDHGFGGKYWSVRRFVAKVGEATPLAMRRMEWAPGDEAQVDFGVGAPVVDADDHRRRTKVLRVVLSHSRKAYSEAAFREGTDEFLQCLENAFWHFGGATRTVLIDNLKAAVKHPDWYDPELNPKVQSFSRHYGIVILPTKPYTPRHKGKVERGIGYVQDNALKGRTFGSLAAENQHLLQWEATVADTRLHGTTRRQVGKVFREVERSALVPLPAGRFPSFREAQRTVHRDGHVEVAKAYYSVPPEYLGRQVWVRWDGRLVRIFNHRMEPIAVHAQHEAGRFSTQSRHIDSRKISSVERGATWLLRKARRIGPQADRWAQAMLQARGIEGVRVLVGLLALARRQPCDRIEVACGVALTHGAFRLRTIRSLLDRGGGKQEQMAFIEEHPIIRGLADYGEFVRAALHREPAPVPQTPE
jgi:transposase